MSRHCPNVEALKMSARRQYIEDATVLCIITLALAALGFFPERNSVFIRNDGSHRLYDVSVLVRDSDTLDLEELEQRLLTLRRDLPVKPALYGADDYPATIPGFSRVYVTVYI